MAPNMSGERRPHVSTRKMKKKSDAAALSTP